MSASDYLTNFRQATLETIRKIDERRVAEIIEILNEARLAYKHIFVIGNGGSAATATHFANDLGKGAARLQPRFRVLSLTDNMAWITAVANDLDYSQIFVEQLKNYAQTGDVIMAFSGSGNSPNVIQALEWGRVHGCKCIGVTGRPGGQLPQVCDLTLFIESSHMGHIEEGHFVLQHMVGYFFMEQGD
ncbi:MAG TPA: SIS domain-containing protein [Acidobacteriota bacterium]|jgi:D-sedoheptulose 7-phosphate isomerase